MQGRLKAVLLCLRYVDTAAVAFGAWFVLCPEEGKFKNKNFVVVQS